MSRVRSFLNIYTIRFRKKHSDFLEIEEMMSDGQYPDPFKIFENVFKNISVAGSEHTNEERKTVTGVKDLDIQVGKRVISGLITSGEYGEEAELLHRKSKDRHPISEDDAPIYDHYFYLYIPKSGPRAIFALHSRGNFGCKTSLDHMLKEYVSKHHPNISVALHPTKLDFKADAGKFYKGFTVRRFKTVKIIPMDNEGKLISGKRTRDKIVVETTIHSGKNGQALLDFATLKNAKDSIKEAKKFIKNYIEGDLNEAEVRVTVNMDGQDKTIRMTKSMEFEMSFDISEDFNAIKGKQKLKNKLEEACESYIKDAVKRVVG